MHGAFLHKACESLTRQAAHQGAGLQGHGQHLTAGAVLPGHLTRGDPAVVFPMLQPPFQGPPSWEVAHRVPLLTGHSGQRKDLSVSAPRVGEGPLSNPPPLQKTWVIITQKGT